VPNSLQGVIEELALANRILAHEGVLDAFGHVSVRHPPIPAAICCRARARRCLVEPDDILEYTLDSEPVKPPKAQLYSERVIHGCIYQARSDVMAVCHHHAPAVMPFCHRRQADRAGLSSRRHDRRGRRRSGISMTSSATPIFWW
jgi:ribulose-5-phosphate 4-epimerase/fuculose-1-phosphate aldolase